MITYFKNRNRKGFTLVEVVVAMSIFSVLTVVVSGIFVNVSNLHRQTANLQRLQNDGRYMIEKIAREIRSREVDYPLINPQTCLLFKPDELGNILMVQYIDDGKIGYSLDPSDKDCSNNPDNPDSWAALNATDVEVKNLQFVVSPLADDVWNQEPEYNIQPRVTILLTIANREGADKHRQEVTLQTTISSKLYKR
jgi:prepilin-type N-terminal cleavage/methylation domain-containing protein